MIDPLRMYDYLERSRGKVLERVRGLSAEAYGRDLQIGLGSLARTLTHTVISEWYYIERIQRHEVPPYAAWPVKDEEPPPFGVIDGMWAEQALKTKRVIGAERDWDGRLEWRSKREDGTPVVVRATKAEQFVQLVLHEVHHRSQAMAMVRQLGAPVGEDLDFNWLMFERREV